MMKKIRIQYFNIVEIALALAIVGIGIAGIMSLFPVGLNASRDAVGDTYAPDIAEQIFGYVQMGCANDTRPDWTTGSATSPGMTFVTDANLPQTKPLATASEAPTTQIAGTNLWSTTAPGVFCVIQKTGVAPNPEITDFSAVIRIWKNYFKTTVNGITNVECSIRQLNIEGSNLDIPLKYGVAVYLEISWPAEKPYEFREKRNYAIELFNQNAN